MKNSLLFTCSAVLAIALIRLLPHPANVTPIVGLAITGGMLFRARLQAPGVILASMLLSDLFIGFHELTLLVYGSLMLIAFASPKFLNISSNYSRVLMTAFFSSFLFFITTNFGVWFVQSLYPKTLSGLFTCYVAALPFWGNSLIGDLFYSVALFSVARIASGYFQPLKSQSAAI